MPPKGISWGLRHLSQTPASSHAPLLATHWLRCARLKDSLEDAACKAFKVIVRPNAGFAYPHKDWSVADAPVGKDHSAKKLLERMPSSISCKAIER